MNNTFSIGDYVIVLDGNYEFGRGVIVSTDLGLYTVNCGDGRNIVANDTELKLQN